MVPGWLQNHVGEGEDQIAQVVLQRARTLYRNKTDEGAVHNPCYLAMDATRPGGLGNRFYVICEASRMFRAIPAGHGSGLNLTGIADFSNGIRCAKNFSDARESELTTGGPYVTAEIRTSFKGYYRASGELVPLMRSFVQFDGEGGALTARPRGIGGHPGVIVSATCRMKAPGNPYADNDGYVPFGKLIDYGTDRSNGCTSWLLADSQWILLLVENKPTTLYIYPRIDRHRRRCARCGSGQIAGPQGFVLERVLPDGNRLAELLAKGDVRAGPHEIQEGLSPAAPAVADLQRTVRTLRRLDERLIPRQGTSECPLWVRRMGVLSERMRPSTCSKLSRRRVALSE